MLWIEAQRSGFHCVSNVSIQHPHTCTMTVMRLHTVHSVQTITLHTMYISLLSVITVTTNLYIFDTLSYRFQL
jgi:hypothetical protein